MGASVIRKMHINVACSTVAVVFLTLNTFPPYPFAPSPNQYILSSNLRLQNCSAQFNVVIPFLSATRSNLYSKPNKSRPFPPGIDREKLDYIIEEHVLPFDLTNQVLWYVGGNKQGVPGRGILAFYGIRRAHVFEVR